jgi:hypothetical protein
MEDTTNCDIDDSKTLKSRIFHNEECKNNENMKEILNEVACSIQRPVMFSRCNIDGSFCGFDDSLNVNKISNGINESESPLLRMNESTELSAKSKICGEDENCTQENESCINSNNFARKKFQSLNRIRLHDSTLSPYDTDFKKPHFLRYSIFEDDIAAFKDESSPNLQSTGASSLSSLTIDDDDYSDSLKPNKAGLVKMKSNMMNLPQMQEIVVQEQWREDPIGRVVIKNEQLNNVIDKFVTNTLENNETRDEKLKNHSFVHACDCQIDHKKKIILAGYNTKKSNMNNVSNQFLKDMQSIRSEAEGSSKEMSTRTELFTRDKYSYQENERFRNYNRTELNVINKHSKSNICERYNDQEVLKESRLSCESHKHNNEIFHSTDDISELNAYEEQLLDQCIRRGMAKVTKRDIRDIKPFCWDLNQICLTTRAMLKSHDENLRERHEDWNKQYMIQKGLIRHMANTRTS